MYASPTIPPQQQAVLFWGNSSFGFNTEAGESKMQGEFHHLAAGFLQPAEYVGCCVYPVNATWDWFMC